MTAFFLSSCSHRLGVALKQIMQFTNGVHKKANSIERKVI